MDDALTESVLEYQNGLKSLDAVRNQILMEAYQHLTRLGRRGEDDVSEFLLQFHSRVERLVKRFQCRGLPFRHYSLRTLRWQWNTFRTEQQRDKRRAQLLAEQEWCAGGGEVAEVFEDYEFKPVLSPSGRKRLVILAMKAAPFLGEEHLEAVCRESGVELAWLQACQARLRQVSDERLGRHRRLASKRSEIYYRRLQAEDDARRETDPERKAAHERRARLYRTRLANLSRQQAVISTSPTHVEVADILGLPKGTVDSGLHHLKKALSHVYNGDHDLALGHQQRAQKA